jgi:serine/threonine protein kinase
MSLPSSSKRKIFDGRYEILSIVGRGADSVVYHGRHITGAAQEVAIKVLINRDGTTTLTDKLRREALTLVSCRHKYVVRLDDFHSIQDLCYLSMEYAKSGDLLKFVATLPNKRLPPDQVGLFLKQCLEAIDFVHATGVIHRDLKPENILVISDKEIRLADFGLALLPGDEVQLEELRNAVGSFDYLAPEVLDGIRYDTVSDLYSLGVCFYEAATGKHPFSHTPIAERLDARRDNRIVPLAQAAPDLPEHVAAVITTLMLFASKDRFQSASDALRALNNPQFRAATSQPLTGATEQVQSPANNDSLQFEESSAPPNVSITPAVAQVVPSITPVHEVSSVSQASPSAGDPSPSRQANPTEKIDLERIKAIIARDTQRRASGSNPLNNPGSPATTAESVRHNEAPLTTQDLALTKQDTSLAPEKSKNRTKSSSGVSRTGTPLFATALLRFVGVALAFALLTVGGIYGYNFLTGRASKRIVAANDDSAVVGTDDNSQSESDSTPAEDSNTAQALPLHRLPEGIYHGMIQGLFPGSYVPMALIANVKQEQLTLLVGVEGWIPATVPLNSEGTTASEGPTFRSNGLILKFNQESSSAGITGTVIDVVTGESGTWKLSQ